MEKEGSGIKCKFCGSENIVDVHEHYTFCTECTALYTKMILEKSNCKHISDSSITVERPPWYKKARESIAYIFNYKCSVCGKDAIADGW
jgi:hypothetical protein